jgi:toxin CcdB
VAQFTVYKNANLATRGTYPLLLDVQSDLLRDLASTVVVPLRAAPVTRSKLVKNLMPVFAIDGKPYAMITPQLAGVQRKILGARVAELMDHRDEIVGALDLLITGI